MASKAEESLGVYFRKLYNSDDMVERDFTFVSKEKTRFPVHSFLFKHRSEFLSQLLLNTNFKEGADKVADLDLSNEASEKFIKFLYGFSLSWDNSKNFDIFRELIFYAGMCGLNCLQEAVTSDFKQIVNKTNVFEILEILKINQVDSEEVRNFVVDSFDRSELVQRNILEKFPKVAVSIVKKDANMAVFKKIFALETTMIKGTNTGPIVQISPDTAIDECVCIEFSSERITPTGIDLELIIHGIGLTLLPGSNVNVKVSINEVVVSYDRFAGRNIYNKKKISLKEEDIEVSVPVSNIPKVYAVQFLQPLRLRSSETSYKMAVSVIVKGSGSARVFPKPTERHTGQVFENFEGQNIKMSFKSPGVEKKPPIIIAEIYCSMPQNCNLPQLYNFIY